MPACPHRPPCPGCPRWFAGDLPPRAREVFERLVERTGVAPPEFHRGEALGFRLRARLSVRGRAASPKIGIFQEGSHRIVDIPRCAVHHPVINEVVARVKQAIRATKTPPYAEGPHNGLLRGVQIAIERHSGRAQLVLIANSDTPEPLAPLIEALREDMEAPLHSLWWNGNPTRHNNILGPHWQHIDGPLQIEERVADAHVFYPPDAFGQSNLDLAEALITELGEQVPDGARVAEFYAGVGAIGLGLAPRVASLAMNELGEGSLRGLRAGIDALDPEVGKRCRIVPGEAGTATSMLDDADVVIVDPPRKGLDPALLDALCERPPRQLFYVSCGIDSFARESEALLATGAHDLSHLSAWAFFRHSEHIETLARFDRRSVR